MASWMKEGRRGEHGKAPVLQLALLNELELDRVLRLDVGRVEAEVTGHVAVAERLAVGRLGDRVKLLPPLGDAHLLRAADAGEHHAPQPDGQLRDLVNGGAAVAREERVELLLDEEAGRREHRDARVRELRLAQAVDLELVLAVEEARGVELAEDVVAAREAVRE